MSVPELSLNARIGKLLASEPLRPYSARWLYFGLLHKPRPPYLSECWRYPAAEFPPPSGSQVSLPKSVREPDVLFLPMTDWHARIQRTQHLALGLAAAGHRCYYVNPHLGFQFPSIYFRDRKHRLSILAPRVFELHVRLPREPVVHHRLPTSPERQTLGDALGLLAQVADARKLVQIVSLPFWLDVAVRLRQGHGFPIIYDCHDLLRAFQGVRREVVAAEADLFRCCDLVVFSSQPLMDARLAELPYLRGKSLLVRNAAAPVAGGEVVARARGSKGRGKLIGYVGALDDWFDVEAVRLAARRQPGWWFVLIGRIESRSVLTLKELPNVRLLGELPHSDISTHLADFDVGLIPFLRNDLTLAANPIKLYEYLRYGLPVVSTRLPEVEMLGDLVYIADGPRDFADKVEAAANEGDSSVAQRRKAAVVRETWADRVRQFQVAFETLSERAGPNAA